LSFQWVEGLEHGASTGNGGRILVNTGDALGAAPSRRTLHLMVNAARGIGFTQDEFDVLTHSHVRRFKLQV
jgi:hypothetical protein